ncbi:MAG: hypothetical protein J3K34DRAFT_394994 [Monoraphidium minutum]|nr:MAG: hypothetical protein J3K34DRAFT_394994 [Monoraphidium minutum]
MARPAVAGCLLALLAAGALLPARARAALAEDGSEGSWPGVHTPRRALQQQWAQRQEPASPPDPTPAGGIRQAAPAADPFRRTLRLPPHVYLISFILLLSVMALLLSCHCWRMCRLAQRMEATLAGQPPSGRPRGGAAGAPSKRSTPAEVITALPLVPYGSALRCGAAAARSGGACCAEGGGADAAAAAAAVAAEEGRGTGGGGAADAADFGAPAEAAATAGAACPHGCAHSLAPPPRAAGTPAGEEEQEPGAGAAHSAASDGEPEACAVCYDEFADGEEVKCLPCGHYFHPDCVDAWLRLDRVCPVCRGAVWDGPPAAGDGLAAAAGARGPRREPDFWGTPFWRRRPPTTEEEARAAEERAAPLRPMGEVVVEVALGSVGLLDLAERLNARRQQRRGRAARAPHRRGISMSRSSAGSASGAAPPPAPPPPAAEAAAAQP